MQVLLLVVMLFYSVKSKESIALRTEWNYVTDSTHFSQPKLPAVSLQYQMRIARVHAPPLNLSQVTINKKGNTLYIASLA